jgi:large subunit ribosomal protein L9
MKIILRQDYPQLGKMGDVVTVKDGYARNYLIPRSIAYHAIPGKLRALEEEKQQKVMRDKKDLRTAQQRSTDLEKLSVSISVKVGEGDRLFGSVTSQDIANALKEMKFDIDKRTIELDEPIKALGKYSVPVKLHSDVKSSIKVWVIKE